MVASMARPWLKVEKEGVIAPCGFALYLPKFYRGWRNAQWAVRTTSGAVYILQLRTECRFADEILMRFGALLNQVGAHGLQINRLVIFGRASTGQEIRVSAPIALPC